MPPSNYLLTNFSVVGASTALLVSTEASSEGSAWSESHPGASPAGQASLQSSLTAKPMYFGAPPLTRMWIPARYPLAKFSSNGMAHNEQFVKNALHLHELFLFQAHATVIKIWPNVIVWLEFVPAGAEAARFCAAAESHPKRNQNDSETPE